MTQITTQQIDTIKEIISKYKNLECVECAQAIQDYLISQKIPGKRIKLYTGSAIGRNSYIYDETVSKNAISLNGRHQGIEIIIDEVEMIFDNHHPDGITKAQWLINLLFYDKLYHGQQFQ
ncbi:MAG: papain fold toxin domain-containing protein, partial [Dolichospermum sp.]